jgi:hypothetical protein
VPEAENQVDRPPRVVDFTLAAVDVEHTTDRFDGLRYDPVVHAHPAAFLGEQTGRFQLLEVVADGGFRQVNDGSEVAGAAFLVRLVQQVGQEL